MTFGSVDSSPAVASPLTPDKDVKLRAAAQELEASFLAEMLKFAGVAKPPEAFGGGAGEEQFSSFLCDQYGHAMAKAGGIGLAQSIFEAMQRGAGGGGDA